MLNVQIKKQLTQYELDIDFSMKDEILVLFGPSGSGKTTILNSIAGLIQPDSGRILLNDTTFFGGNEKPLKPQRRNIGYLFQDYALFPHMTVEKNISYGVQKNQMEERIPVITKLVAVLGIGHLLKKYPHQISGGEKQRVALARALATEPDVLLLDEPLSALDEEIRIQCQDELLRLHEIWSIPFIIVTHNREEAEKLGDRILLLQQGKVVEMVEKVRIE